MADPNDGGDFVRITNREIWTMLTEVRAKVTDIANEMDSFNAERLDTRKRVRALELRFYGILAGLIGAFTVFGAIVAKGGP